MTLDPDIAFDNWQKMDAKSRRTYMYNLLDRLAGLHKQWNNWKPTYGDHPDDYATEQVFTRCADEIESLFPKAARL